MFLFHTFERFNYDIWMTFRSKNVFDLLALNSVPTTTKEQALQGGELLITGVVKPRNFNIQAEVEGRLGTTVPACRSNGSTRHVAGIRCNFCSP